MNVCSCNTFEGRNLKKSDIPATTPFAPAPIPPYDKLSDFNGEIISVHER